LKKKTAK